MSRFRSGATVVALAAGSAVAGAQVGHDPTRTPYRDLEHRQEVTVFAGYLASPTDVAGVAWRGGPMLGGRYELHVGGPAYVYGRVAAVRSERSVKDPARPTDDRVVEERTGTLLTADLGVALSLTGHKAWHGLSPVLQAGLGGVADFRGRDIGSYRFGTPLALTLGGGVRWSSGGRLGVRVDATDYLYRITYPERYYRVTGDIPALLDATVARNRWTHNGALTVGLSYLFGR